jgi:4-amino-4-deoxy-L-arabinose transferase-like glycosyltransferase
LLLALVLAGSAWLHLTVVQSTVVDNPLRADSGEYFSYAYNLHESGVYSSHPWWLEPPASGVRPDSIRPPGYPLFLFALGPPSPTLDYVHRVQLAQAGLWVLSVLLVYLLGAQFLPRGLALVAAALTGASPHLLSLSTNLLSETLFCTLLLAATLASVRAFQAGAASRWPWLLAGLAWGAASLVRSTAALLPPIALALVLLLPRWRSFRVATWVGMAGFALVLGPWIARNASGQVDNPKSSLMVKALAHGSYPGFMFENRPETFGFPYRFDPDADRIAKDLPSVLRHIAGRFRDHPVSYSRWFFIAKPGYFLAWGNIQGWDIFVQPVERSPWFAVQGFRALRFASLIAHWPLMFLGLVGIVVAARPGRLELPLAARLASGTVALVVAYAIAFHLVVAPFPRYGLPFRPLIYLLAMLALLWIYRRASSRHRAD